jgi:hypothetical protein
MKKILSCIICLALAVASFCAQQPKRVYITLDVSGSMYGDKYALANYTTQMIVTLCNDDDEVSLIIVGRENNLSAKPLPLQDLQNPVSRLPFVRRKDEPDFEINDIIEFNRVYKPSKGMQDWLFIIGDGEWDYGDAKNFQKATKDLADIVKKGTVNVCYLQTGTDLSEESGFTKSVKELKQVDIHKSDTKRETIKQECNYFARKILGFSESLEINQKDKQRITFESELPLVGFYLVCQDETNPKNLPKISSATADGNLLKVKLKGTPTTMPINGASSQNLSGHVFLVKGSGDIPANTKIEVEFDKAVKKKIICIYPIVQDVNFGSMNFTRVGGNLMPVGDNVYTICQDEKTAMVRIELDNTSKGSLPEALLKKTNVIVKANGREYKATYNNGGFECNINLREDTTQYYAECECPGYFKRTTQITTIVKGDCEPTAPEEEILPEKDMGSITFKQLRDEDLCFAIEDSLTSELLDPEKFDTTFEVENGFLYEKPEMRVEDGKVYLKIRPKGDWCECLFPTTLKIKMVTTPKDQAYETYGKNYKKTVSPFRLEVVKDSPWLSRCLWVMLTIIGLILLFYYLRALQRKRRFKKNASLTSTYYDYYDRRQDGGTQYLRKEGFGAWVARWLLPGDEYNTLSFDSPNTTLRFDAAESYDVVNIPKDGNIDPETMHISGYRPDRDNAPKEPVKLGNNGKISITTADGKDDGYLLFTSGSESDGNLYRIIIALMMVAITITVLVLLYLLVRSYF